MDENWNVFDSAQPEDIIKQDDLGEPIKTELPNQLDIARRRLKRCIERWPEAEVFMYDPRCCRFPKNCSPYAKPEQVVSGVVTDDDLEVL